MWAFLPSHIEKYKLRFAPYKIFVLCNCAACQPARYLGADLRCGASRYIFLSAKWGVDSNEQMCYYKRATMSNSSNNPFSAIIGACQPSIGIIDKKDETVKSRLFFCAKKGAHHRFTAIGSGRFALRSESLTQKPNGRSACGAHRFLPLLSSEGFSPSPSAPFPWGRGNATHSNLFTVLGCLVLSHSWYTF